jgi:hypothetical protein
MNITLTINAANPEELHYQLRRVLAGEKTNNVVAEAEAYGKELAAKAVEAPAKSESVAVEAPKAEEAPVAEEPKAKKTRAKKPEKAAPVIEAVEADEQDVADEEAEAEVEELTHDHVRKALRPYVEKYGMEYAQTDGPVVFGKLFGETVVKVSDIPSDQASLQMAIDGINELTTKNPFKRKEVA